MKNLGQMMRQAQQMQERMQTLQKELESEEVEGSAAGGMVTVTLNGKGAMRRLKIDPSLVTADDAEVLEDLIVAAHNDARTRMEAHVQAKMAEITGGLQLPPGMNLPF